MKSIINKLGRTKTIIIGVVIVLVGVVIYFTWFHKGSGQYQFVSVKKGSITETISVTGNTTPVQSLDLAFQNGGNIAEVDKNVGDQVSAGAVIARLDTSGLQAQLAQAQASVDAANAKLASLQAGAQPADIQQSQAALAGGQQTLTNMYSNVSNTLADSYAKANDAVRTQLNQFFSNAENNNPQLTFTINDSQTLNNVNAGRLQASEELNAWQAELGATTASSSQSSLDAALVTDAAHLSVIKTFLINVSHALLAQSNLSNTQINTYNADVTAALNEVNTATVNVNTASQNIASQKITVQQLQAALALKLAGSTAQDIAAQQAAVEQAQANAQSVQVSINEASMISPISGVVTVQNAKVGQIASPGTVLVSIISSSDFEIDSEVPETDIGKVAIGNPVNLTFDAFPGETFTGKVFYIDPAQTLVGGVVDYKVKVSLDKPDSRIKSGLTANLDIQAQEKDGALILPQFAVLQNDQGSFVEVLNSSGAVQQIPVTLGIQDDQGNVEITSGVTEGEQVINIGLKQGS
jgi:RND family efflux transporter MFP subunit